MKISILLPYKENFSLKYAGAVSLFVKDTVRHSKFSNTTFVFGNMTYKKAFLKNYINLKLSKSLFQSSSKNYVSEFLKQEKKIGSDIVEIHNRPNYIKYLKNEKKKKILYFHNDPLSMKGSTSIKDRLFLLNNIDKILFNSRWSQKRFFIDIPNKNVLEQKTSICYQSTSRTKIDFTKKKKLISFVGKLNSAKGYDLFGKTIIKILNKYPDWHGVVFGDERRQKLNFKHKNLNTKGYTNHNTILKFLEKVSISVVCSKWNEPFGRTSLEAASRGSAVIISNKGGLPETSKSAIILKKLDTYQIFNEIEKLILNKKRLLQTQVSNYSNFVFDHKFISKLLDNIKSGLVNLNSFNIRKKIPLKIFHITNFNERFNGRLHYNTGKRLNNGFLRNNHNILTLSDRDVIHNNRSLKDPKGLVVLQNKVIEAFNNFRPDLIVLGHADRVTNKTLSILKDLDKNLKIAQWFLDPLSVHGPDHTNNKNRILDKLDYVDKTFLTTDPNSLSFKIPHAHFIPNPSDPAFETLSNFNNNPYFDVFFAMSHGVHRGDLKKGKTDKREIFINQLIKSNLDLKFDIYGMNNIQPIWSEQFMNKISNSYMGINLSRGKPIKYYSSDRIAQLVGNGLLTFIDERTHLNDFFSNNEIIFYKNLDDLSYKLNKFKNDKILGKKIAKAGKIKYTKYFNSNLVSEFIINKCFDIKTSNKKFIWEK
jgi:glycosyltransferase involved in cell wall biosynthesis